MAPKVKPLQDLLPEELVRLLFNKLAKTYPLVTEEWRIKRRPLLEALIAHEYDDAKVNDDDDLNSEYRLYSTAFNGRAQGGDTAERLFSDSINFLKQLRLNGPWILTAIIPDGSTTTTTARTATEINAFVRDHDGERNLYYSVNPTRKEMTSKAKKKDI